MTKENYYNSVTDQVYALKDQYEVQIAHCFDFDKLSNILPACRAASVRRIILTGCGDSYSAAGAMKKAVIELSGIMRTNAPDIIDFCSYYPDEKICSGNVPSDVLVIGISFSGTSKRVADALERANSAQVNSLLITNQPDSICGKSAAVIFNLDSPEGCNTPGLRSYFASLTALAAIGAYLGVQNGHISKNRFYEVKSKAVDYLKRFMNHLDEIDDMMFDIACKWKSIEKFEAVADGNEGFSAQFVEQKLIECAGRYCEHTTSEEFAHISFFHRDPSSYGMIIMITKDDPSFSRMKDIINGCRSQHRHILIISDGEESLFAMDDLVLDDKRFNFYGRAAIGYNSYEHAAGIELIHMEAAPESWMSPLTDFIPGSLLAGYIAAVNEIKFFAGKYDFRMQKWLS